MNKKLKERNMPKVEYEAGGKNSRSNMRKAKAQYEVRLIVAAKNKKNIFTGMSEVTGKRQ